MHVTIKIFSFEYSLSVSNVNVISIINCYSIASVPGNAIVYNMFSRIPQNSNSFSFNSE